MNNGVLPDDNPEVEALKRSLEKSITADSFIKSKSGKMILDYIDSRVSQLINELVNKKLVSDRDYCSLHGAISELQRLSNSIRITASMTNNIKEQINDMSGDYGTSNTKEI